MGLLKQILVAGEHIHHAEAGTVLTRFNGIGQGNIPGAFPLGAEIHENFVLNTSPRIGGQPRPLAPVKGGDGLNEPNGANGDEIILIRRGRIVFLENMGHQP